MKKPSRRQLTLLFIFLLIFSPLAHAARVERLVDSWQPKHYAVNITLNHPLSQIASATPRIDVVAVRPEDAGQPVSLDGEAPAQRQEREQPLSLARAETGQRLGADPDCYRPEQPDRQAGRRIARRGGVESGEHPVRHGLVRLQ